MVGPYQQTSNWWWIIQPALSHRLLSVRPLSELPYSTNYFNSAPPLSELQDKCRQEITLQDRMYLLESSSSCSHLTTILLIESESTVIGCSWYKCALVTITISVYIKTYLSKYVSGRRLVLHKRWDKSRPWQWFIGSRKTAKTPQKYHVDRLLITQFINHQLCMRCRGTTIF